VKSFLYPLRNRRSSLRGREHHVNQTTYVTVRHDFSRPFGTVLFRPVYPGLPSWATLSRPYGTSLFRPGLSRTVLGYFQKLSIVPSGIVGSHNLVRGLCRRLGYTDSLLEETLLACLRYLAVVSLLFVSSFLAHADSVGELSDSFWQWRAQEQPFSTDDIPRIERPANLVIDWSAQTIQQRLQQLDRFEQRWKALAPPAQTPVHDEVDYRLLGSALARVRWELAIEQGWKRDPQFYVDQTLGSVFHLLLQPPPFSESRQQEIIKRVGQIPTTLQAAQQNLTDLRQPFAQLAIESLDQVSERSLHMQKALTPYFSAANNEALQQAIPAAITALTQYRAWLTSKLPAARKDTAIGRDNYLFFLRKVALLPYTPEQLLAMSQQEWSRSVAFEAYQQTRLAGASPAPLFPTADAQIQAEKADEEKVRAFLVEQKILTVPTWMKHYRNLLLPDYLEPFQDLGENDDLTGPSRLDEDGTSYIRVPGPNLGFFKLSQAHDPRPILVHEGIPGHYFQLCLGWHNPDPIRRHYYDSGANEGLGFYAEEMMLQAGFFDDNPHTRETIYSFMRLRALRVAVDVKLALGEFTLQQGADYLARTVPMDRATALDEAAMFSSTPGQGISYQIGKLQIIRLLSDARRMPDFSMLKFNDFAWNNGNVPIALQRWELLQDASDVPR
jgi:uncharacterized protein (DUF885 family)